MKINIKIVLINFLLAVLFFALLSCSSAPTQETHYFVLNPNKTNVQSNEKTNDNIMQVAPIQLAEFLDQPGIVLQTDTHQIEVAHYHRWGEPLKRNMHRYILESLSMRSNQSYINSKQAKNFHSTQTLTITVNEFNGTTDGKALLSGNWSIMNSSSSENVSNYAFRYESKLSTSGYPELVNKLAELLNQLCDDIVNQEPK